ncbi:MAG: glycosyltransferase, partial [Candidatus Eisenbacteria bacterium]|nr:glycosyltransferase [Candidatus Latescibacterota bacterium]MBD3300985.1 glycosyltransferase [Candidatus Eisenbacteria bacterium]
RESLARRAEEEGIAGSVAFVGSQADVRPFLWRASLFVLASDREGLPLSVLEAMAAGLPCVCTAVGEIPEIVRDGETGRLVPPGDPEALADAILDLFTRRGGIEAMGETAQRIVGARYGLERCVDAIEEIYAEILARGQR